MDKIWYRNPSKSEVIGSCGGDEKNQMTTQNRQQSNVKNKHVLCSVVDGGYYKQLVAMKSL